MGVCYCVRAPACASGDSQPHLGSAAAACRSLSADRMSALYSSFYKGSSSSGADDKNVCVARESNVEACLRCSRC
jgi:hypothetical protein